MKKKNNEKKKLNYSLSDNRNKKKIIKGDMAFIGIEYFKGPFHTDHRYFIVHPLCN